MLPSRVFAVLIFLLLPIAAHALPADAEQRIAKVFSGTDSAFVLLDVSGNRAVRFDAARCKRRMTPFSTFKVPNSIIALETGALAGAETVIRWDPKRRPAAEHWPEAWRKDHDLRSAFKASAVWFFQEVAVRVGKGRMAEYLRRFQYGNQDISGGIDQFWLDSSLRISADEQAAFLRALWARKLGISQRTWDLLKDVMVYEEGPGYVLRAKTGGGPTGPGKALGWFVGSVEREGKVYVFALNTDGPSYKAIKDKRIDLAKAALRAVEVLPEAPRNP